jgi:arachidonate 15-lipoxygenase
MAILSALFPRRRPSLPQNDSAAARRARQQQLRDSQQQYQWTETLENVEGVPMSASVPAADEPSLPWLLAVSEVGLALAENFIAVKLDAKRALNKPTKRLQEKLDDVRARIKTVRSLSAQHADNPVAGLLDKIVVNVKQVFASEKISFEGLLAQFKEVVDQFETEQSQGLALDEYTALFQTLPLPAVAHLLFDDASFARYRVAGPNPMLIKGIKSLPVNFPLTPAQFQSVMGADDSISAAASEHRLYLLDYAELVFLAEQPGVTDGLNKYVFAPIALFALAKGSTTLQPVAIQCGQDPARNPLFFPAKTGSGKGWGWQMAKLVVQIAECNYHELFVHLARTHLMMEAFAVATHRHLASTHPLNILLVPHCIGTLFINNAAAAHLISPGSPIDHFFGAPIERSQKAAGTDRLQFDFYANMLPRDLKARAVDNPKWLPDYPYRDDALLLWGAIENWARNYVEVYYADEAAVLGDTELNAWAQALILAGKVKGFTAITSRAQLVSVLTMIIFTASAQHAAVNFPQRPFMTYAPELTGAGWQNAPAKQDRNTEQQWLNMLPPIDFALEQLNILTLLGSVHYRALGDYRSNHFPYLEWFEDSAITKANGPLVQFQTDLTKLQSVITARNRKRISYEFLLPSNIPNSINI